MKKLKTGVFTATLNLEKGREYQFRYLLDKKKLINDRKTGNPRGFGFVKMEHNEAISAIRVFNGTEFGGRTLLVNEAREHGAR
jgi:RNA recognition motif-containing protein